ncbi:MAG: DUF1552 domain-containing protein [Acidobacteriota bacterium]|nr:DUF1552 domain-containing protein [Acidobacteriota bacterium]
MIYGKALARRTFLRGIGTAVALPFLDAMTPAFAAVSAPITRVAFVYTANGVIMRDWTPAAQGAGFAFPRTLAAVEPFRDQLLVLSGLAHRNGEALGDGPGDHARAGASWLTGQHPYKTQGADIRNGMSVDQMLAREIGQSTALPSLELGLEDVRLVGGCDSGYSCAYSNTLSWISATTPLPYENNPRRVFERLFGDGDTTDPVARAKQARQNRSLLDFVLDDAHRLEPRLGAGDRRKLSDYLDSVREVERRIQIAESRSPVTASLQALERPEGIPPTFEEHVELMADLMKIAFQADLTRVITLMMSREGGNRTYPQIGVPDAHHGLSHHQNDPDRVARLQKIDQHHVAMFGKLLERLRDTEDEGGTLLDHSMVVYGSSLSDSNAHTHDNLPTLLAGGGAGALRGGRHVRYAKGTPMTNLFLTLFDRLGIERDEIGDSTGRVGGLG